MTVQLESVLVPVLAGVAVTLAFIAVVFLAPATVRAIRERWRAAKAIRASEHFALDRLTRLTDRMDAPGGRLAVGPGVSSRRRLAQGTSSILLVGVLAVLVATGIRPAAPKPEGDALGVTAAPTTPVGVVSTRPSPSPSPSPTPSSMPSPSPSPTPSSMPSPSTTVIRAGSSLSASRPFTTPTKILERGQSIILRVTTAPLLARTRLSIWIAVKGPNGKWGAYHPHGSVTTNAYGVATYVYATSSAVWLGFRVRYGGDAAHAGAWSYPSQFGRWR